MAQQQWIVPGPVGQQYRIGLYHGIDSGNLMVHCNNEVLLVEFKVLESSQFSFFLGEELYELKIEKKGTHFSYQLSHNEEIDSPHNRRVGSEKKHDKWRIWAMGILVVLFSILFISLGRSFALRHVNEMEGLRAGGGIETKAHLIEKAGTWYASYITEDRIRRKQLPYYDSLSVLGFPYREGDQLPARYAETDHKTVLIDWESPGEDQLAHYRELTLVRHSSLHPELAPRQVRCQVALAEQLEGAQGLAKFYRQADDDFPTYNKNAYLRLVRSQAFREGLKACL